MNKKSEIFPLGVSWEQHSDKQQYLFRRIESLKTKNVEYLQDLREAYREIDKKLAIIVNLKSELETSMKSAEKKLYYAKLSLKDEDDYEDRQILHEETRKNRNEIKIYKNLLELIK